MLKWEKNKNVKDYQKTHLHFTIIFYYEIKYTPVLGTVAIIRQGK